MLIVPSSRQWGLQHAACVDKCSKFVVYNHHRSHHHLYLPSSSLPTLSSSFRSVPDPKASASACNICVFNSKFNHISTTLQLLCFFCFPPLNLVLSKSPVIKYIKFQYLIMMFKIFSLFSWHLFYSFSYVAKRLFHKSQFHFVFYSWP